LGKGDATSARESFAAATMRDPVNARAWSGLSSAWASLANAERVPVDEGFEQAEAAANKALALDSTQGTALINLAFVRALRYRSVASVAPMIQKAQTVDPGNPEVFMITAAIYRHAWRWDDALDAIRIARKLDPITWVFFEREATIQMCAGRTDAALRSYVDQLSLDARDPTALAGRVRVYAAKGQYAEALTAWRAAIDTLKKPALGRMLSATAPDSAGYWSLKHAIAQGGRALPASASKQDRVHRLFETGEWTTGYALLDTLVETRDHVMYRLPCNPQYDEVRNSPRFRAIVQRAGPLPFR
jgi:Flp pilus assembly protein TadD